MPGVRILRLRPQNDKDVGDHAIVAMGAPGPHGGGKPYLGSLLAAAETAVELHTEAGSPPVTWQMAAVM